MCFKSKENRWLREEVLKLRDRVNILKENVDNLMKKENTNMAVVKLSSPWMKLYHEIRAMFAEDQNVHVIFDEDKGNIVVYAQQPRKAAALGILLNKKYTFGNVEINVIVPPTNSETIEFYNSKEIYDAAFNENHALSFTYVSPLPIANDTCYVVFKNCVVQYFNDDLSDIHGNCSTLYQEIAKEIFNDTKLGPVNFCTDVPAKAEKLVKMCP